MKKLLISKNEKILEILESNKNRKIVYKILNPGGNKTAIVYGNAYSKEERKIINTEILKNNKDVEQVGFISKDEKKLEMAGGEFCVNATRCAIWEYLKGKRGKLRLEVSGSEDKIIGGITIKKEVYVKMKINKKIEDIISKKNEFNIIDLDGILLLVIDEINSKQYVKELKENQQAAMIRLKNIMKLFETSKEAVGIILLEKDNGNAKINPVIWVKTVDTLYYETACGSGSLAAAIYINSIKKSKKIKIIQPSGYSIIIKLNKKKDYIKDAIILGKVKENNKNEC